MTIPTTASRACVVSPQESTRDATVSFIGFLTERADQWFKVGDLPSFLECIVGPLVVWIVGRIYWILGAAA
jgi:hypothetical protein